MSNLRTKNLETSGLYKDDSATGSVVARFSTFDIVDREGDIVRQSAFTDGQEVPMVWAHDWTKPIGKGVVRVSNDHARFEGEFFPTTAGQEARATVRAMGGLQQWSWGFRVLDTQPNATIRGYDVTKAEVFEVSPVLVGANQATATLAVKDYEPEDPITQEILTLANEVMEVPDLDPHARAVLLMERASAMADKYAPTENTEKQLHEVRTALAREQIHLESIWLG